MLAFRDGHRKAGVRAGPTPQHSRILRILTSARISGRIMKSASHESTNTKEQIHMARTSPIPFMRLFSVIAAAALALLSLTSSADTPNAFVGTWVLNVSKSTFDPPPPLKSSTVTVTPAQGRTVHTIVDIVEADGTSQHVEYTTAFDGKAVPVNGY